MIATFRVLMILSIGIACAPAGFLATARADEVPSVDEILEMEKRMLETRKAIRSGRVVVRTRLTKFPRDPSQENVTWRHETYLEDGNIRVDSSVGENRSQTIVTPDNMIRGFSDQSSVHVFGPQTRPERPDGVSDPRRLGIVVWYYDSINNHGYEGIFLNPNRDQFKVEAGTDAGEPVWKVSFRMSIETLPRPIFGEYWLSESKGGLPVYIGTRDEGGDEEYSESLNVKLKEYGPGGVWFPSEATFRRTRGGEILTEQITTVEEAVFGEDLPDETFMLAGMGLPEGKIIDFDGELATWNGQRAVGQGEGGIGPAPPPSGRVWWAMISIVLAVVAAVLLGLRAKRRRAA